MSNQNPISGSAANPSLTHVSIRSPEKYVTTSSARSSITLVSTCSNEKDVATSSVRSSLTLVSANHENSVTLAATSSSLSLESTEKAIGSLKNQNTRVDGGRNAWLFLLGAFMVEGLLYGFPLTFGVFQRYYETNGDFGGSKFLPVVGTLAVGISKLAAPIMSPFITRFPGYRKCFIWSGWLICILSLVGSSFSTQLWHLILTQGALFSIGFLILYYPLLSMLNEWWIQRRGFAYGILFGCGGIFGLLLPILLEKSLNRFGSQWTLRGFALLITILVGPTLPLLKAQGPLPCEAPDVENSVGTYTPESKSPNHSINVSSSITIGHFDTTALSKVAFTAISFSNIFQGLVFFLPNFFIPAYATTIGLSTLQGTIILSITNVTTMASQIGLGYIADCCDPLILMFGSTFLSALTTLSLWGLSKAFPTFLLFGIFYGLFAGGYSVLYCRFATSLTSHKPTQTWLYSIFESQRGVVIIAGGIMSGTMVGGKSNVNSYGAGSYEDLILAIGISLLASSLGGLGWFFRGRTIRFFRQ
ncbi:MFS general substrate transporter [Stipitochalara longipes BDJ]|nr:MFS general substrate transporter [Stipitochalara longipes BDJ]